MARFQLVLQDGTMITFGWDAALGFFLVARRGRRLFLDYDTTTDCYDGLPGLLRALVASGLFTTAEVEDGLEALLRVEDIKAIEDPGTRAVAIITQQLKQAAADAG